MIRASVRPQKKDKNGCIIPDNTLNNMIRELWTTTLTICLCTQTCLRNTASLPQQAYKDVVDQAFPQWKNAVIENNPGIKTWLAQQTNNKSHLPFQCEFNSELLQLQWGLNSPAAGWEGTCPWCWNAQQCSVREREGASTLLSEGLVGWLNRFRDNPPSTPFWLWATNCTKSLGPSSWILSPFCGEMML